MKGLNCFLLHTFQSRGSNIYFLCRIHYLHTLAEDGSKIVLFGGSLDSSTFFDTIYVLDVVTGVWKQGASASAYRTRMACGFMAGQFVAFGGSRGSNRETTMHDNVPIIYDLDLDVWSTGYDPAGPTGGDGGGGNGSGDGGDGGDGKSNTAVIAAAVGGVVAVILIGVAAFFFFRRRRQNRDKKAIESEARIAAAVADEDERQGLSYRLDPVAHHKKYMNVSTVDEDKDPYGRSASGSGYSESAGGSSGGGGRAGQMTAMDHYAAAAALQAQPTNSLSPPGTGGAPRIHSTYSDAYTHGTSENDYSALMPLNNNNLRQSTLPSGGASPIDPELYHQQQLHQQQLHFQQQQQYQQMQQQDLQQQLQHQQQLYHSLGVGSGAPPQPGTYAYPTTGGSGYPSNAYEYSAAAAAAAAANASPLTVQPYQQHQQPLGGPYQTHNQQRDSVIQGPQSWTGSVYDTPSQTQSTSPHPHPPLTPTSAAQPWAQGGYHGSESGSHHNWSSPSGVVTVGPGTPSVSGASTRGPQGIVPTTAATPSRIGGAPPSTSQPGGGDLGYVPPPN